MNLSRGERAILAVAGLLIILQLGVLPVWRLISEQYQRRVEARVTETMEKTMEEIKKEEQHEKDLEAGKRIEERKRARGQ